MSRSMQARFEGRDVTTGLVSREAGCSWNRACTVAVIVAILPTSAALGAHSNSNDGAFCKWMHRFGERDIGLRIDKHLELKRRDLLYRRKAAAERGSETTTTVTHQQPTQCFIRLDHRHPPATNTMFYSPRPIMAELIVKS
jgi:hypothetical protein